MGFTSGGERRVFVRPRKLDAGRVCINKVSSSLPRSIRRRVCQALPKLRRIGVMEGTCTVRCSYVSTGGLCTSLRFGTVGNLFDNNRFGKDSKCRRTTYRKLVTKVGTTVRVRKESPLVLSQSRTCVKILVSSLIAGGGHRPCHVVASQTRCHLLLHRSGTSLQLAGGKCRVKLVSRRQCS